MNTPEYGQRVRYTGGAEYVPVPTGQAGTVVEAVTDQGETFVSFDGDPDNIYGMNPAHLIGEAEAWTPPATPELTEPETRVRFILSEPRIVWRRYRTGRTDRFTATELEIRYKRDGRFEVSVSGKAFDSMGLESTRYGGASWHSEGYPAEFARIEDAPEWVRAAAETHLNQHVNPQEAK